MYTRGFLVFCDFLCLQNIHLHSSQLFLCCFPPHFTVLTNSQVGLVSQVSSWELPNLGAGNLIVRVVSAFSQGVTLQPQRQRAREIDRGWNVCSMNKETDPKRQSSWITNCIGSARAKNQVAIPFPILSQGSFLGDFLEVNILNKTLFISFLT